MGKAPNQVKMLSVNSLHVDAEYEGLFPEQKGIYEGLVRDMRADGWKPSSVIVAWENGFSKNKHTVLDGHTRLRAAKEAGLERVKVELVPIKGKEDALARAAKEQVGRRNLGREQSCLAIVARLIKMGKMPTRNKFSEEYGFGEASVGRATTIAKRGTAKEIAAALDPDSPVSLKVTVELIKRREQAERATDEDEATESLPLAEPEIELVDEDQAPEELMQARDLAHELYGRAERILDILTAGNTGDILSDLQTGRIAEPLSKVCDLAHDIDQAVKELLAEDNGDEAPTKPKVRKGSKAAAKPATEPKTKD